MGKGKLEHCRVSFFDKFNGKGVAEYQQLLPISPLLVNLAKQNKLVIRIVKFSE